MSLRSLLVCLLCLHAVPAVASEKSIWSCRASTDATGPILHLVEWSSRSYVKFAHVRFSAEYQVKDDQHGWYFDNDGSGYYRYALILDAHGKAWFHDFNDIGEDGLSTPLDRFLCTRTS